MRTTQAKFAGEGQAVTEKLPDTLRRVLRMERVAMAPNFCTMLEELLF